MIIVSDKMFDTIMARAQALAEEQFRRMVFDTGMQPEAAELVREQVVDTIAERIIDRWTAAATSKRDDQ